MFNLLNKGKDLAISTTLKMIINTKIKKYGSISELILDSQKKTISLVVALKGETTLLNVLVKKYKIEEKNSKHYLSLTQVETSRKWLSLVIQDYLSNQKFEIPKEYISTLKAIM